MNETELYFLQGTSVSYLTTRRETAYHTKWRNTLTNYDSTQATIAHIQRVRELLVEFIVLLSDRASDHDESKLASPEKEMFDEYTPLLKSLDYGSAEYKEALAGLGPALEHHYGHNRHHPEHHRSGVSDMTLVEVVEMFVDWKAASERHDNGSIERSLAVNQERFGFSLQLTEILWNTAVEFGWIEK